MSNIMNGVVNRPLLLDIYPKGTAKKAQTPNNVDMIERKILFTHIKGLPSVFTTRSFNNNLLGVFPLKNTSNNNLVNRNSKIMIIQHPNNLKWDCGLNPNFSSKIIAKNILSNMLSQRSIKNAAIRRKKPAYTGLSVFDIGILLCVVVELVIN